MRRGPAWRWRPRRLCSAKWESRFQSAGADTGCRDRVHYIPGGSMRKSVVLTLFLGFLAAAAEPTHPGTERWAIKISVPDGINFSKPGTILLADLLAMPDAPGVKHNDPRYEAARIPADSGDK